jgi:hypothetical protein
MYQSLIWSFDLSDDPRCLSPSLNTERRKRLPDALVDSMRRDLELCRDFLRRQMPIDEEQAIELAGSKLRDPGGHQVRPRALNVLTWRA